MRASVSVRNQAGRWVVEALWDGTSIEIECDSPASAMDCLKHYQDLLLQADWDADINPFEDQPDNRPHNCHLECIDCEFYSEVEQECFHPDK